MNLAAEWDALAEQFAEAFGEQYTLARGSQTATVTAQTWVTGYETNGPNGLLTVVNGRDLLIQADHYAIAGQATEPRQGDRLTDPAGRVWEVLPIAGRPAAERHGNSLLVRTKQI